MSEFKPRHFVEKKQQKHSLYYWRPSKSLLRAGFRPVKLGKNRVVAIQKAEAINNKVDQWRGGQPVLAQNRHGTLPWLIERYKESPRWAKLRGRSKEYYNSFFNDIMRWSASRGDPPMRTIKRVDAEAYWSRMHHDEGTPAKAHHVIATCKLLWNYAIDLDEDVVGKNRFQRLGLPQLPPRDEVWTPGQIAAVIETALAVVSEEVVQG
jgi:hypothetical protein